VLPGKKYTADEVVRILRRKWWLIALPFVLGAAAGVSGYLWMPLNYRSDTLVMVIPRRMPDAYVKSTVTTSVEDRVSSIKEQIQSRARLERIIRDFDLYKKERASRMMDGVVQQMRGDIDVALQANESSFRIGFISRDARTAQRVAERLATLSIEENVRDRENVADDASRFLESQLQDAKLRLMQQEKKLEEYRRVHAGQLPSQQQANLLAIQNAQTQLQGLGESMNRARERRLLVDRQIADSQAAPVDAAPPPGAAAASPEALSQLPAAQQLEAARGRLEQLKQRYTERHPDVLSAQEEVRRLQVRVEEEARLPAPQRQPSPAELAQRRRIKDLQAERDIIDHQLATSQAEEARLRATIGDYQSKLDALPARESELAELTRDYKTLQESYSALLQKKEDSKVAANLERREISEQLKILDHASLPQHPHNQRQRLLVLAAGPIAGLLVGVLLLAFLEYRESGFKREEDVLRVLSLPVLALIPAMGSATDESRTPPGGKGGRPTLRTS
jgi:polysaccharide chain length determinant protein (PEP-CTERM system associated)